MKNPLSPVIERAEALGLVIKKGSRKDWTLFAPAHYAEIQRLNRSRAEVAVLMGRCPSLHLFKSKLSWHLDDTELVTDGNGLVAHTTIKLEFKTVEEALGYAELWLKAQDVERALKVADEG